MNQQISINKIIEPERDELQSQACEPDREPNAAIFCALARLLASVHSHQAHTCKSNGSKFIQSFQHLSLFPLISKTQKTLPISSAQNL